MNFDLLSSFGKMFPDCSIPTTAETLQQSSWRWTASGIMEHGQVLMLDISAWHSADDAHSECSLDQILEPDVAQKYFLSPIACAGILRRAEKRNRPLPEPLRLALTLAAAVTPKAET